MNTRGKSLFLPDNLAVQRAKKLGHNKGWNAHKFQDMNIIEGALRQSTNFTEFSRVLRKKFHKHAAKHWCTTALLKGYQETKPIDVRMFQIHLGHRSLRKSQRLSDPASRRYFREAGK